MNRNLNFQEIGPGGPELIIVCLDCLATFLCEGRSTTGNFTCQDDFWGIVISY